MYLYIKFRYDIYSDKSDPEYYFINFYVIEQKTFSHPSFSNLLYKYKNL